jgi:branched-chain amino acid transport system substrate-binding protein
MKKLTVVLFGLLLVALVLAACGQAAAPAPATKAPAAQACKVVFGAAVSFTGKYAKEGELTKEGYDLFVDTINKQGGIKVGDKKCTVEVKYYDDESTADTSAQLIEKLISEDKVQFLLGPYSSGITKATSAISEKHQVVMVEANGADEAIFNRGFKYVFGVLSPASMYLRGTIDMLLAQNPKPTKVAIIYENAAFSSAVAEGAKKYAEEKGLEVVYFDKYPKKAEDVSSLITAIKGKNPDVLLGAGHFQDAVLIVKQSKDLGLNVKHIGLTVGPAVPEFRETLGADANYVSGAAQWTPVMTYKGVDVFGTPQNYTKMFKEKYGKTPDYHNAESTAALIAYQYAIEKAGSLDSDKIRDALSNLDIMTFFGPLKFDERGINMFKSMAVEQIQNGEKYTVWPSDVAEKPPMYPAPAWSER